MIWLAIAVVIALLLVGIGIVVHRRTRDGGEVDDVDPLFAVGIAITGAGAVLGTTLGPVMFAMMAVGLVIMVVGSSRTRHHHGG